MTFKAGDIEATAKLDRTPFAEGLRLAIQEGEDFARKRFTATADVQVNLAELDRLERRVKDFASRKFTTKVDVDVSGNVRLDALIRKLDEFSRKTYTAKVDLDTEAANAKLDELKVRLGALDTVVTVRVRYRPDPLPPVPVPPGGGPGNGPGGGAAGGGGIPFLPILIGSVLPLIGPLAGAATAAVLGTAGAVGVLGAAFLGLKEDIKAGSDEVRPMLGLVSSIKEEAEGLGHTAERAVMGGLLGSLRQVKSFLPTMDPVVARLGVGLGSVAQHLTGALTTTLTKSTPLMVSFVDLLDRGAASLQKFVASDRFTQFLAYSEQELPKVLGTLGDLGKAVIDIGVALQPVGDRLLRLIDFLARAASDAARLADALDRVSHFGGGGGGPVGSGDPGQPKNTKLDYTTHSFFGGDKPSNFQKAGNAVVGGVVGVFTGEDPYSYKAAAAAKAKYDAAHAAEIQAKAQEEQILATQAAIAQLDIQGHMATTTIAGLGHTFGVGDKVIAGYAATLGIADDALKAGSISHRAYTADVSAVAQANRTGTASTMEYLTAVEAFSKSEHTAADRAALISATLKQANGDLLGYANSQVAAAQANQTFVSSMTPAVRATINMKTGLVNYRDAAAGPLLTNLAALQDAAAKAAGATYQHEQATGKASTAAQHAADQYYAQTHGALIAEAHQLGLTKEQATRLADQYFAMPKDIKTRISQIGADPVVNVLNQIGRQLAVLTGKPWVSTVQAPVSAAMANLNKVQALLRATTGNKTLTVVADVSRAYRSLTSFLSSPATKVVQVVTSSPHGVFGGRQVTNALGNLFKPSDNLVKAYGFGGVEDRANNHQPTIYPARPSGLVRVFAEKETEGEAYIPLANDHRRPGARTIAAETTRLLGGVAYFAGGGGYGFDNVQAPKPKRRVGGAGGGSTADPNSAAKKAAAKKAAAAKAAATAAKSLGNTVFTELAGVGSLINGTVAHVNAATIAIQASVRKAFNLHFTNSALVNSVNTETALLRKAVTERVATHAKLLAATSALNTTRGNMAEVQSSVAGNILGRFDIGTSGNGYKYGIQATLTQDLADARKFASLRTQAQKLGLDKRLIAQITAEGPQTAGRNLEAIVSGGAGYVKTLNSLYGQFNTVAQGVGAAQAKDDYGVLFAKQSATVNKLTAEQTAETKKITHEVALLRADLVRLQRQLAARGR